MTEYKNYTDLRPQIFNEIISADFITNIKTLVRLKNKYNSLSNSLESIAHLLLILSAILAFATGYFKYELLIFISGSITIISVALLRYSLYLTNESTEKNNMLSNMLKMVNIDPEIDISNNVDSNT